jgi:hypothetical protein
MITFSYQRDQNVPFDAVQQKRQDRLMSGRGLGTLWGPGLGR